MAQEGQTPQIQIVASVIVPVHEDGGVVGAALEALLDQSFASELYEIVIVDSGSNDNSVGIVKEYEEQFPSQVRVVIEEETPGRYAARNRAILGSRGRIIAFTEADCVPDSEWLKSGVTALEQVPASCGGGRIEVTFSGDRPNVYEEFDRARKPDQQAYVETEGFAAMANFFAWKGLFDSHGTFKTDLEFGADYEFGRRVTSGGEKLVYIPQAVVRQAARSTFGETYSLSKQVVLGQRQLQKLGLVDSDRPFWVQMAPAIRARGDETWALSWFDKLQLVFVQTLVRWLKPLIR